VDRGAHQPQERQPPPRAGWVGGRSRGGARGAGPTARGDERSMFTTSRHPVLKPPRARGCRAVPASTRGWGAEAPTRARMQRCPPRGVHPSPARGGAILPHAGRQGQRYGLCPADVPGCPRVRRGVHPLAHPPRWVAIAARRPVCGSARTPHGPSSSGGAPVAGASWPLGSAAETARRAGVTRAETTSRHQFIAGHLL
jgi:hypothetical protein